MALSYTNTHILLTARLPCAQLCEGKPVDDEVGNVALGELRVAPAVAHHQLGELLQEEDHLRIMF